MSKLKNNQARKKLIDEILADLKALKKSGKRDNQYALNENIRFFNALRDPGDFFNWLFFESREIDGARLLELSDLPLPGKWAQRLQQELLTVEKMRRSDMSNNLREAIVTEATKSKSNERLIFMNFGAGNMEIDHQVMEELINSGSKQKIMFIGVDSSRESIDSAKNNLKDLDITMINVDSLAPSKLASINREHQDDQYVVLFYQGDVFEIKKYFKKQAVDLVYHLRFKHHIPRRLHKKIDNLILKISKQAIEADDLKNPYFLYVPIGFNWDKPVLLNGQVFSCLRDKTEMEIKSEEDDNWSIKLFKDGYFKISK